MLFMIRAFSRGYLVYPKDMKASKAMSNWSWMVGTWSCATNDVGSRPRGRVSGEQFSYAGPAWTGLSIP